MIGRELELTNALLDRLESNLPQRVSDVDTGEKADEFRFHVSAEERAHLANILRRIR